jgi:hypothetical protein
MWAMSRSILDHNVLELIIQPAPFLHIIEGFGDIIDLFDEHWIYFIGSLFEIRFEFFFQCP